MSESENYAFIFKSKVALGVLSGEKTITDFSNEFGVIHTPIYKRMRQLMDSTPIIFFEEMPYKYKRTGSCMSCGKKSCALRHNTVF